MQKKPKWKEYRNPNVFAKGYRMWRHMDSRLWVVTKGVESRPPIDSYKGGYYNVIDLFKDKGI